MPRHDRHRLLQIALGLLALFDNPHPKGALRRVGLCYRLDHRQRQLALAEIVADILAQRSGTAAIIQQIINNLKRDPQGIAIAVECSDNGLIGPGNHRPRLGRRRKQGCRLAAHHLQIDRLIRGQILRRR